MNWRRAEGSTIGESHGSRWVREAEEAEPVKPELNVETSSTQRRRDKRSLRLYRIERAVTTRGGNSRPVGEPGDRPGCPGGAKAARWATRVGPQVCGIALRETPRVAVTGQRREN